MGAVTVPVMAKSLAALLCVFTLVACGGGAEEVDKAKQADAWKDSYPDCGAIWQVGKKLPANYEFGCLDGDSRMDTVYTTCADGKRRLFVHHAAGGKNTHIAITGEEIRRYNGATQSAAYAECLSPSE